LNSSGYVSNVSNGYKICFKGKKTNSNSLSGIVNAVGKTPQRPFIIPNDHPSSAFIAKSIFFNEMRMLFKKQKLFINNLQLLYHLLVMLIHLLAVLQNCIKLATLELY
jgi:hypothetical protein